jgi:hypothetical protein
MDVMQNINHILSKEGILTTFHIAKRVSKKDILRLQDKLKSDKTSDQKLRKLLAKKMAEETKTAFVNQTIPGLIVPGQNIPDEEKRKMMELTYFASVVAKKIGEKQLSKFHACYVINAMVNILGLTESDFDEFHRKFSKYKDGSDTSSEQLD